MNKILYNSRRHSPDYTALIFIEPDSAFSRTPSIVPAAINLIKWKILRKNRLPVNLINFRRRVLKKRKWSKEYLGNLLSIEAAVIVRNATGEAMNYGRVVDEKAGFFLKLDLLLDKSNSSESSRITASSGVSPSSTAPPGKQISPWLAVQLIGADLKKKVLCVNKGDGYGIVFLIGFRNNICHFSYTHSAFIYPRTALA